MAQTDGWDVQTTAPMQGEAAAPSSQPLAGSSPAPTQAASAPAGDEWEVQSTHPINATEFEPETAGHPLTHKIDLGLKNGVLRGFGLQSPDPNNPDALSGTEALHQVWNMLKSSAQEHYQDALGGSTSMLAKPGAAVITPFTMAADGYLGMAKTGRAAVDDLYEGAKAGDMQRIAQGAGTLMSILGQLASSAKGAEMGEEVPAAAARTGEEMQRGASRPGNTVLGATKAKNYLYGKDPGKVFLEPKLKVTNNLEQLKQNIQGVEWDLRNQVHNALNDPAINKPTIDHEGIIDYAISKAQQQVANEKGLLNKQEIIDELHKLQKSLFETTTTTPSGTPGTGPVIGTTRGTYLTPAAADDLARDVARNTDWTDNAKRNTYINSTRKAIYGELKDDIERKVTQARPDVDIHDLNQRRANAIEAEKTLDNRIARDAKTDRGLSNWIKNSEWATAAISLLHTLQTGHVDYGTYTGAAALVDLLRRTPRAQQITARTEHALGTGLEQMGKSPLTREAAQGAGAAAASAPMTAGQSEQAVRFRDSRGGVHEVPASQLEAAKQIDPGLQVIQ